MRRLTDRELKEPRFEPIPRSRQRAEAEESGSLPHPADLIEPTVDADDRHAALSPAQNDDRAMPPTLSEAVSAEESFGDLDSDGASPSDIIARAASTVREDRDAREIRELFAPEPDVDDEDEAFAPLPPARPNHRARRRLHLNLSRLRKTARALRFAPVAALVVGVPVWLWQAGHIEAAHAYVARQANAAASGLTSGLDLRVAAVRIEGAEMTGSRAIGEALGIAAGTSILSLDLHAARDRLTALPWVKQAEIERRLPGQLRVRIVERTPIARLRGLRRVTLIDTGGNEIAADVRKDRRFAELPLLSGDRAAAAAPALMKLLSRHPRYGRRVLAAHYQGRRRWDLKFDTGVILMLPEKHVAESWSRFVLYAARHGLLNRRARHIDMRLHDRMVIRLEQPETPKAPPAKKRRRKGRNG